MTTEDEKAVDIVNNLDRQGYSPNEIQTILAKAQEEAATQRALGGFE